jgi:hypothetical protein
MKRLTAIALLALVGCLARPATARATWVSDHCYSDNAAVSAITRSDARAYGEIAAEEGYNWGGGCWNNNDRDDTPGGDENRAGDEGPDCSGLVFKTWDLKNSYGAAGFQRWNKLQNIHGPYSSYDFHSPTAGGPFKKLANKSRDTTQFMDAFAKQGHIGLLDTSANPTANTDWILEAVGFVDPPVGINEKGYRYDSSYRAIARKQWKSEPPCDPYCLGSDSAAVVVP